MESLLWLPIIYLWAIGGAVTSDLLVTDDWQSYIVAGLWPITYPLSRLFA